MEALGAVVLLVESINLKMRVKENVSCLASCEIKCTRSIFKFELLIYQSRSNFDVKILFGKVTHLLGPETKEMLVRVFYWDEISTFFSGP